MITHHSAKQCRRESTSTFSGRVLAKPGLAVPILDPLAVLRLEDDESALLAVPIPPGFQASVGLLPSSRPHSLITQLSRRDATSIAITDFIQFG